MKFLNRDLRLSPPLPQQACRNQFAKEPQADIFETINFNQNKQS